MLIGVGSYIFRYSVATGDLGPVDLVEKAASYGAELVQFAENLPLDDVDNYTLDRVRETAERLGVLLEAGTAGATEVRVLRHLEIAKRLNAKLVRLTLDDHERKVTKEEAVQVIQSVLPEFEKNNIHLAIENHFTMSSEDMVYIVKQINHPLVGFCLDTANSIANQEWPDYTVKTLVPWALSLHLKDYQLEMQPQGLGVNVRGTPLGEGRQNIQKVIETVYKSNPTINVVLEQWMPAEETIEQTIKKEHKWIQQAINTMKRNRSMYDFLNENLKTLN